MNEFIEQTIYRMNEFTKQSLSKKYERNRRNLTVILKTSEVNLFLND